MKYSKDYDYILKMDVESDDIEACKVILKYFKKLEDGTVVEVKASTEETFED